MSGPLQRWLQSDDAALDTRWQALEAWFQARFNRQAGIEAMLFLIGVQVNGTGYQPGLRKEAKQDLIMEGAWRAFEALGLYYGGRLDADGRIIWERTTPDTPNLTIEEQEKVLKLAILAYFDREMPARG